jgi:hypothetical protein
MRYQVKVDDQMLTFNSIKELEKMYIHGFVSPEDMVKPENSERWVAAGTMPVLRGARPKAKVETQMVVIVAMTLILLVLLGAVVPFIAYRKRR